MRTNFKKLILGVTLLSTFSSCQKEVPGPQGPPGNNGVSNIEIFSDNLAVDTYIPVISAIDYTGTTVLLSVFIPDLRAGDVISVNAESQLEDEFDLNYATILESTIGLADTDGINPEGTSWISLSSSPASYWLLNEETYANEDNSCIYECPQDFGDKYLNFVVRVKSSSANTDDLVKVHYNSCHLDVAIFKTP
jgi:hypothetical protein